MKKMQPEKSLFADKTDVVDEDTFGSQTEINEQTEKTLEKLKIITFRVYEKKLRDIWSIFIENNFKPVLIKGWAAAINYDNPHSRQLGDYDLAVNPADYDRALTLQRQYGLGDVDLHNGLRRIDTLDWQNLYDHSILVNCGSQEIRILRPEDHLRVLCTHWLGDGGREKIKLQDIFYAVKNRPADFDWFRCLETVGKHRRQWTISAIAITHKYLGLEIKDLPFAKEAEILQEWIIETVEKEWNNPVKFAYLESCIGSRRDFWAQLQRRIPPNPISATIWQEGKINGSKRFYYQFCHFFNRMTPSFARVSKTLYSNVLRKTGSSRQN